MPVSHMNPNLGWIIVRDSSARANYTGNTLIAVRYGRHEVARFTPATLTAAKPKQRKRARPLGHKRAA